MKLRRTCREVTRLVLEREDRRLPLSDRLVVQLHLTACDACTNFVRQVNFMRRAVGRWRSDPLEDEDEPPP